jgi:hypothetical protein
LRRVSFLWGVVYACGSRSRVERIVALLNREGILATLRREPPDGDEALYEVLVSRCEVGDAQEVIRAVYPANMRVGG